MEIVTRVIPISIHAMDADLEQEDMMGVTLNLRCAGAKTTLLLLTFMHHSSSLIAKATK